MPSRRASKPSPKSTAAARPPQPRASAKDANKLKGAPTGRKRAAPVDLEVASPEPSEPAGLDRSRQKSRVRELTWAQFDRMVQKLARQIQSGAPPDAVVGVAHGGVFVGGALASALGCEFFPVRISRRSRDAGHGRAPKLMGEMPRELSGRKVLIVDDVASSGDTLELAKLLASRVGAKRVATACLVTRVDGYTPDWTALTTAELVVFPWDYEAVSEDGRFDVDPDKAGA